MANAEIGFGATFQRGSGGPPLVYADVGEVLEIRAPELSRDTVDTTHFKSTGRFKEYTGGLRDAGEAGFKIQFDQSADLTTLIGDFKSNTLVSYRIVFPDATNWTFEGLITAFAPEVPLDDRMTCDVTIKLTGQSAFLSV